MEVYKLGKTIENQVIDIHLALQQLNEARDALKNSLKRRKEIAIAENDTHYKETDTTKLFTEGNSRDFGATIVDLMENNRAQVEEIRNLKLEQESQTILLFEVTEQKKKAIEPSSKKTKESWQTYWKKIQKSYPRSQTINWTLKSNDEYPS